MIENHPNRKYTKSYFKKVLSHYSEHTGRETAKHFNLTLRQFQGIIRMCTEAGLYQKKDKRNHEQWDVEDYLFCIKHSGTQDLKWIASQLDCGRAETVMERFGTFNSKLSFLNGPSQKLLSQILGPELIPWITIEKLVKALDLDADTQQIVSALAKFQRWVFKGQSDEQIVKELKENGRK